MRDNSVGQIRQILPAFILVMVLSLGNASTIDPSSGPGSTKNISPMYYGLNPPWGESARIGSYWALTLTHASIFQIDVAQEWGMRLDMEITELRLSMRKSLTPSLEIGIELPVVGLHAGLFDGLIDAYHNIFHFNDYGRSQYPRNEFYYTLTDHGLPVVETGDGHLGLGDIQLNLKQSITHGKEHLAFRLTCEVPTGNAERGAGNGSFDWGLTFILESHHYKNLTLLVNLGAVFPGDIHGIRNVATQPYFMFVLLTEFQIGPFFALHGDITLLTSPFAQTMLPFLNNHPVMLTLGLKHTKGKSTIGFSFMEDLNVSGAPDISIQLFYAKEF